MNSLTPQHLLHRFPFCKLIHELVHISDFLHKPIFHILYLVLTDSPSYQCSMRIEGGCLAEERLEVSLSIEYSLESHCIISCEPQDDLIDFGLSSSLFLDFCYIEWIDPRDGHGEYFSVLHDRFDGFIPLNHSVSVVSLRLYIVDHSLPSTRYRTYLGTSRNTNLQDSLPSASRSVHLQRGR